MKFEWKVPRIVTEPMVYGKYLTLHPDMMPEPKIPLDTKGYLVQEVDYGMTEENKLPFKKGDWIDEDYVSSNFRELDR